MSFLKAAYYPEITYTQETTRFGANETTIRNLYENSIQGRVIIKIDLLDTVKWMISKDYKEFNRDRLYKLLSGSYKSDDDFKHDILYFYSRYDDFAEYVNGKVLYDDKENTIVTNIIKPLREAMTEELKIIEELTKKSLNFSSGKILLNTHDIIYVSYKINDSIPEYFNKGTWIK